MYVCMYVFVFIVVCDPVMGDNGAMVWNTCTYVYRARRTVQIFIYCLKTIYVVHLVDIKFCELVCNVNWLGDWAIQVM